MTAQSEFYPIATFKCPVHGRWSEIVTGPEALGKWVTADCNHGQGCLHTQASRVTWVEFQPDPIFDDEDYRFLSMDYSLEDAIMKDLL